MPRVTLFIGTLSAGGAQRQLAEIARALRGSRWQPLVDWHTATETFTSIPDGVPAELIERNGRHDPHFAANLRRALGPDKTDLVHAFLGPPSLYAALARQWRGGVPTISAVRNSAQAFEHLPVHGAAHLAAAFLADHVVTNARDILPWMRARGVPLDRLDFTPNMLAARVADKAPASDADIAACLQRYGLDPADPPLTLVGRFDEFKNQDGLVRALATLKARGRELPPTLLIGRDSDPARVAEVRRLAAQAGLDRLVIAPPTPDILTVLQSSRLVALVSHSEGTPNVVMEALGLGVPVVATPVGQVPDLIIDGQTGVLAADTSDAAIAAALDRALSLPARAIADMKKRAYADMRARYGAERIAADLMALYDRVLARPRPPRIRALASAARAVARL